MLTAGHCGNNLDIVKDGAGDLVGDISSDNDDRDTQMVDTRIEGQTFAPNIYTGPFNSNTSAPVVGATADFVGNLVCTGGARSGEHCGITVTEINVGILGKFPTIRGELTSGCAAASGDSGGPVYNYDDTQVVGRGTITAGAGGNQVCPNAPRSQSFRIVYWAPLLRPDGDSTVGSLQFYGGARML
jgi:hypothetical protein